MIHLNEVRLSGRLCDEPQLRHTPNGTPICELRLASNHRYRHRDEDREETTFITVVAFGATAESLAKHPRKGSAILISARLKEERWESKEGEKRSKHVLVAERWQYAEDRRDDDGAAASGQSRARRAF